MKNVYEIIVLIFIFCILVDVFFVFINYEYVFYILYGVIFYY